MSGREGEGSDSQDSGPRDTNEGLVFRYDRTRRLENASPQARWLAERYGKKGDGPIKSLLSTRWTRLMLLMVAVLAAAYYLGSFLTGEKSAGSIGSDHFEVKAFWYEGRVLVGIHRTGPSRPPASFPDGPPLLRAKASVARGGLASSSFPLGAGAADDFRLAVDGAEVKPRSVKIELSLGGRSIVLEAKVE